MMVVPIEMNAQSMINIETHKSHQRHFSFQLREQIDGAFKGPLKEEGPDGKVHHLLATELR